MSRADTPLQTTHLRKSLIALACRAACLELGRDWRERTIADQVATIAKDPALGPTSPPHPSDYLLTGEESAALIKRLRNAPPLPTSAPIAPEILAQREDAYRQNPALWNWRLEERKKSGSSKP